MRAGVGASHLRLFLEVGFVPHSICLGRKRLLLQKGACPPEGRGFTPLLAPLRGSETSREPQNAAEEMNPLHGDRAGEGGRTKPSREGMGWRGGGMGMGGGQPFAQGLLMTTRGFGSFCGTLFW